MADKLLTLRHFTLGKASVPLGILPLSGKSLFYKYLHLSYKQVMNFSGNYVAMFLEIFKIARDQLVLVI